MTSHGMLEWVQKRPMNLQRHTTPLDYLDLDRAFHEERRALPTHAIRSESESAVRRMIDATARDPRVWRNADELEAA